MNRCSNDSVSVISSQSNHFHPPGEDVGVFDDGELGRSSVANFEDASPFGEIGAVFLVFFAAVQQTVQALSRALVLRARQAHHAFVHFDTHLHKTGRRNNGQDT